MNNQLTMEKKVFCNRTLNLNSIKAIGYDMDYTLIQYNVKAWEERAYTYTKNRLVENGWPVDHLKFDFESVTRALLIDKELGNIIKANKFGYIKKAAHGTKFLDFREMRQAYPRTLADPGSKRYASLDTLFSISEACIYSQLVDLLDQNKLPLEIHNYGSLYNKVRATLDEAHFEGLLKAEIISSPEKFIELDPETAKTLLDQKYSGKKLMLITNSDWEYTRSMMNFSLNQFLPKNMSWQDLFDLIIVSSSKPYFFTGKAQVFKVMDETGFLKQCFGPITEKGVYLGGNAKIVENFLGLSGDKILYVGDHVFTDIIISKTIVKWRSAMILRELEIELKDFNDSLNAQKKLERLMKSKEELESKLCELSLELQYKTKMYGNVPNKSHSSIEEELIKTKEAIYALDVSIAPLVISHGEGFNQKWGYLMRTGNDKSHLMNQLEKYADIYTSRVSNLFSYTPFKLFRPRREVLQHDPS